MDDISGYRVRCLIVDTQQLKERIRTHFTQMPEIHNTLLPYGNYIKHFSFYECFGRADPEFAAMFNALPLEGYYFHKTEELDAKTFYPTWQAINYKLEGLYKRREHDLAQEVTSVLSPFETALSYFIGYAKGYGDGTDQQFDSNRRRYYPSIFHFIQFPSWCRLYPTDIEAVLSVRYERPIPAIYEQMYT